MDRNKMMSEIQRNDSDVPLQGFSLPKFNSQKFKEKLELPDQFLRACTLREGTWVIVLFLNAVALALIGFLATCLLCWKKETDKWWVDRFKNDFDYYYMRENYDMIEKYAPMWEPISQMIIGTKAVYFVTGVFVIYALVKKTVHPCWYVPWILVTGFLCGVMWFMAATMVICIFILLTYRPLTVTWDIGPIVCVIAYSYAWTYSLFVVVAHYKRRVIVKYWRDRGVGAEAFAQKQQEAGMAGLY